MLEFDRRVVRSEEDLNRTVRSEEEIEVLLRAKDEDENLSHLVLRDKRGNEIAGLECLESQLGQCTAPLKITAPDRAERTVKFSAVAVDHMQEESAPITMSITTEKRRVSSGGGGGSSSSQSTPASAPVATPTPVGLSNVKLGNGQAILGGVVELPLTIDWVPDGLSGYDVKVTVADPSVGRISKVDFPADFSLNNQSLLLLPAPEVRLVAVDILENDPNDQIQPGDTSVVLALITFEGLKQGVTSIVVSIGEALGFQDENSNNMSLTTTNGELAVP